MSKASKFAQVEVKLEGVRLSFAHIFRPKVEKNEDGEKTEKFQAAFLIDKDRQDDQVRRVEDAIEEVKEMKWGRDAPRFRADKICLRDGDDYDYDGYAGMMAVSSSNSKRPSVVDRNKSQLVEADGKPYSGCYVNAVIRVWAQDNKYGKRINASLEAIQFVKDGEAFSGYTPVDTDEVFDDMGDDGDSRGNSRSRGRDDDRASRGRDRDDDRGSRGRERDDDRGSRSRDDDRGSRRGGEDEDRGRSRGRDEEGDRGSRGRERDDDRGRSRERDDDRGSRSRDDDRGNDRGRGRERDDDRGRRR